MLPKNKEDKKKEIIEFLKNNRQSTYRTLKKAGYTHLERVFSKGLNEGFQEAGLIPPRNFKRKNLEERRKTIIDYIKKHPTAGSQKIINETKVNIKNAFNNIKEAFETAEIPYTREEIIKLKKRNKEERKIKIINLIKENPQTTLKDITQKLRISPYKLFKNFEEIYQLAGINNIKPHKKRTNKKRKIVLEFIKNNQQATQREINKECKTRVQSLFNGGIFQAYNEAEVNFPFERLNFHGAAIGKVKQRAKCFENEVAKKLSKYGKVSQLIKTKRGRIDIILERKDKKLIIEVKDYLNKEISKHEIKQLNRYLEDCQCNLGILICHNKPKEDKFLMGKNKLIILNMEELNKIPSLMDTG